MKHTDSSHRCCFPRLVRSPPWGKGSQLRGRQAGQGCWDSQAGPPPSTLLPLPGAGTVASGRGVGRPGTVMGERRGLRHPCQVAIPAHFRPWGGRPPHTPSPRPQTCSCESPTGVGQPVPGQAAWLGKLGVGAKRLQGPLLCSQQPPQLSPRASQSRGKSPLFQRPSQAGPRAPDRGVRCCEGWPKGHLPAKGGEGGQRETFFRAGQSSFSRMSGCQPGEGRRGTAQGTGRALMTGALCGGPDHRERTTLETAPRGAGTGLRGSTASDPS